MTNTLIVIAGPTAIGKTALAICVAKEFGSEILSADSRQFYKEMSIGTARPSDSELAAVPHHFIASHSVTEEFSVGDFEKEGLRLLDTLFNKRPVQVLVGGSGLYVNAITEGFDKLPKPAPGVREALNKHLQIEGLNVLQERLKEVDPEYYNTADIQNPQRVIRALEVYETTGKPISSYRTNTKTPRPFNTIKIGLNTKRETLYNRINTRVDQMMAAGLLEEVRGLQTSRHLNALNTVGYAELFEYLDGKQTLTEAVEAIKQNTRRFAKRQMTWFRKDTEMTWFEPGQDDQVIQYLDRQIDGPVS